jgi:hypothetical protein
MSGDKDAMIAHLEKCEKRMLEQFAEIRKLTLGYKGRKSTLTKIVELCDVYLDKRNDKQKMQDEIEDLKALVKGLMKEREEMQGESLS